MNRHDPLLADDPRDDNSRDDDTPVAGISALRPDSRDQTALAPCRRRPSHARRARRAFALLALAVVGYYLISLFQVWSTGRSDQADAARPVDAIVVMGAAQYDGRPSPQLAARLDHALELWPHGVAPLVVVTGGNQPGDRFTEASVSAAYLSGRGVPIEAIVQESTGRTSYESLRRVAAMLGERGVGRVLIVTDPYHSLRSRLIAQSFGLEATVSPTPTSVVTGGVSFGRHLQEAAGVAVGRLIGFDAL